MQGGPDHPKAPLGNNFRPPQPLLHRPVRTNIDFRSKQNGKACPSMYRDVHYKGNASPIPSSHIANAICIIIYLQTRWGAPAVGFDAEVDGGLGGVQGIVSCNTHSPGAASSFSVCEMND
uniref:Uncharacterized protein n=1 Tax=Lutzomyia longipalpis TaxID=7200 RepID=A0A1B0CNQ5_LUTLO